MAIQPFLAMTAAEIFGNHSLPPQTAWMACHFSLWGPGLTNLPQALPPGSLLLVDDSNPIRDHDPRQILDQLAACTERLACRGVVLDFQRPDREEAQALAALLVSALPCPVAVTEFYAASLTCPVFLSPVPPSEPPEAYFSPWKGREVWLELALDGEQITVTEEGSSISPLPVAMPTETDFFDNTLLCHYRQEVRETEAVFTLYRSAEDIRQLLAQTEKYGVTQAIGLYQEFFNASPTRSLVV